MNVFEGWITPYRVNRFISDRERAAELDVTRRIALPPIDRGMTTLNSSFVEYVDRHFFLRGWAALWGLPFLATLLLFAGLFLHTAFATRPDGNPPSLFHVVFCMTFVAIILAGAVFVWRRMILKDFFSLTHFPVRFDRKNGMVHSFLRDGSRRGREISVPWHSAFFHVAPVERPDSPNTELRCHVVDEHGQKVLATFAIGNSGGSRVQVLQHWEMIRRFMEEGVEHLPFPPLDLYVSTTPSLRNAFLIHVAGFGDGVPRLFAMPLTVPWAIARYLAMWTCRAPTWSDDVLASCRVEIDDPHVKREPLIMAQFQSESRSCFDRSMAYRHEAEEAGRAYAARTGTAAAASTHVK